MANCAGHLTSARDRHSNAPRQPTSQPPSSRRGSHATRANRSASARCTRFRSPSHSALNGAAAAPGGRRCARCRRPLVLHGRGAATVTIHHRTYAWLGRERRGDVDLLCWPCHRGVDWWRHRWPAVTVKRDGCRALVSGRRERDSPVGRRELTGSGDLDRPRRPEDRSPSFPLPRSPPFFSPPGEGYL